jgi:hypothetical protein
MPAAFQTDGSAPILVCTPQHRAESLAKTQPNDVSVSKCLSRSLSAPNDLPDMCSVYGAARLFCLSLLCIAHNCRAFSARKINAAPQHDQKSDFSLPKIRDTAQAGSRFTTAPATLEDNFLITK